MTDGEGAPALDGVALLFAIASGTIAVGALFRDWGLQANWLDGTSHHAAVMPGTAVALCLLCIAMILGWYHDGAWRARVAYGLLFAVIGMALVNIVSYLFTGFSAVDLLLPEAGAEPGHMAISTEIGLLMAAYCVLALMAPDNPDPDGPTYFAVAGFSSSLCVMAGHALDTSMIHDSYFFHGMHATTALAFACFFAAVLAFPHHRTGEATLHE